MKRGIIVSAILLLGSIGFNLTKHNVPTPQKAEEMPIKLFCECPDNVNQGSTNICYIKANSLRDISALSFEIRYDNSAFEIYDFRSDLSAAIFDNKIHKDYVSVSYLFENISIEENETLICEFNYVTKTDAPIGENFFDILVYDCLDKNLNSVNCLGRFKTFNILESKNKSLNVWSYQYGGSTIDSTFNVSFDIDSNQATSGLFVVNYDYDLFEVLKVNLGSYLDDRLVDIKSDFLGEIRVSFVSLTTSPYNDLFNIDFKIIKNRNEISKISFAAKEMYDKDLNLFKSVSYETTYETKLDSSYRSDVSTLSVVGTREENKLTTKLVLGENSYLGAGDFTLIFDPNVLSFNSCTFYDDCDYAQINDKKISEGILKLSIISLENIMEEIELLSIDFDIIHQCFDCESSVKVTLGKISDSLTLPLTLNVVNYEFKILGQGHDFTYEYLGNEMHRATCSYCSYSIRSNCSLSNEITKEPTCTEKGIRRYYCTKCDYSYETDIKELGHDLKSEVVSPTCTEKGYTLHYCSRCDYSFKDNYVNELGHDFVNATCNHNGTHTETCSRCDETRTADCVYVQSESKNATCVDEGYTKFVCRDCGEEYTETIPAIGHQYEKTVVSPTCEHEGYTLHVCKSCGDEFKDNFVSVLDHSYGSPIYSGDHKHTYNCTECNKNLTENCTFTSEIIKNVTDVSDGLIRYTCTSCGFTYDEIIKSQGHTYKTTEILPTCTESGYILYECETCDASYKVYTSSPLGHHFNEYVSNENGTHSCICSDCKESISENCVFEEQISKEPTCKEKGIKTFTCKLCGYSYQEEIHELGHDIKNEIIEPTCTEKGYTIHYCSRCDYSYKDSYVDPLGHDFTNATCNHNGTHTETCSRCQETHTSSCVYSEGEVVNPTCTEDGSIKFICDKCGDYYKEIIPLKGHIYEEHKINPTCEKEGYTVHVCEECGLEYKDEIISPLGHEYGEAEYFENNKHRYVCDRCGEFNTEACVYKNYVEKEATCSSEGIKVFECIVCGHTYRELIPMLEHHYVDTVVPPTCIGKGYVHHECSDCGYVTKDQFVDELGHNPDHCEWLISKEATITEDGLKICVCSDCNNIIAEEIVLRKFYSYLVIGLSIVGGVTIISLVIVMAIRKKKYKS